jgi:DNA modification methylase
MLVSSLRIDAQPSECLESRPRLRVVRGGQPGRYYGALLRTAVAADRSQPMGTAPDRPNLFAYGDNLDILRRHIASESVDLVYLDPPFNSQATYNILFGSNGEKAEAQLQAFEDTWTWDTKARAAYEEIVARGGPVADTMRALRTMLGTADLLAYLAMMAPRLVELQRVLKPTGTIYLHCDPTASPYLRLLLNAIFGPGNFLNEIVWKRTTTKGDYRQGASNWPRVHDVLLYFARDIGARPPFAQLFTPYAAEYIRTKYAKTDKDGRHYMLDNLTAPGAGTRGHPRYEFMGVTRYWRYNKEKMEALAAAGRVVQPSPGAVPRYKRYLDEMPGVAIGDVWDDIPAINSQARERLGYQTQKPIALMERVLLASSSPGDVVLDPFCGCGTTVETATLLGRRWIGIDVTQLAANLIKHRLVNRFGPQVTNTYDVIGEPTTAEDAAVLARDDPFQFQAWALGLVGARIAGSDRKGGDKGIDGRLYFHEFTGSPTRQIILSVKGGKTVPNHVRDLRGVIEREQAEMGVLITFEQPSSGMRAEAAEAGFFTCSQGRFQRIQLRTISELLAGKRIEYPVTIDPPQTLWPIESIPTAPTTRRRRVEPRPWDPVVPPAQVSDFERAAEIRADYGRHVTRELDPVDVSPPGKRSLRTSKRGR